LIAAKTQHTRESYLCSATSSLMASGSKKKRSLFGHKQLTCQFKHVNGAPGKSDALVYY
jgi:hypothetical protein